MTFMLGTEDSKEAVLINAKELKQVTYIKYFITFLGDVTQDGSEQDLILAFFDLSNEVNILHPAFAESLGLVV